MPQVRTSSEAGPGTKIIYIFIIHICLRWNIYVRMDDSLVHFIRVAWGTFRRWIYPNNPTPPPPWYSNDRYVLQACISLAGEPGPDWATRRGGTGINFSYVMVAFWCHDFNFNKLLILLLLFIRSKGDPAFNIYDWQIEKLFYNR
jgi:hypothetical protein